MYYIMWKRKKIIAFVRSNFKTEFAKNLYDSNSSVPFKLYSFGHVNFGRKRGWKLSGSFKLSISGLFNKSFWITTCQFLQVKK